MTEFPQSLQDVVAFRDQLHPKLQREISRIEGEIIEGRDEGWVDPHGVKRMAPIYLTKGRVKSTDSIYRKLRRDYPEGIYIQKMKDFFGIRVIVMFDNDIVPVLQFLLAKIIQKGMIDKIKIFNMGDRKKDIEGLAENRDGVFSIGGVALEFIEKEPGYSSIHLQFRRIIPGVRGLQPWITSDEFPVELQLRTLLQDVWSEMEHKLSYKQGKTDSNIPKAFDELQQTIRMMTKKLTYIQDLRQDLDDKVKSALQYNEPYHVFNYEDDWKPENNINKASEFWLTWQRSLQEINIATKLEVKIAAIDSLYQVLKRQELMRDSFVRLRYYIVMEKAYVYFKFRHYAKAKDIYEGVRSNQEYENRPVPHFRYGEVLLNMIEQDDHILSALSAFDKALTLLSAITDLGDSSVENLHVGVGMLTKIATVYDLLSHEEFLKYQVALLNKAWELSCKIPASYPYLRRAVMWNNMAWTFIENFDQATSGKLQYHSEATKYIGLMMGLENNEMSRNAVDTITWYLYLTCKAVRSREPFDPAIFGVFPDKLLDKAKQMNALKQRLLNNAPFMVDSDQKQKLREDEINATYRNICISCNECIVQRQKYALAQKLPP